MKTMIEQLTALQKENQESQQNKMSEMTARTQQESNIINQLKAIVNEKEGKVKILEKELTQLKQSVSISHCRDILFVVSLFFTCV